jgi:hypothetical protein
VNVAPSTGLDEVGWLDSSLRDGLFGEAVGERLGVGCDDGPAVTLTVLSPLSRWLSEAQATSAPAAVTSPAQSTTILRGT